MLLSEIHLRDPFILPDGGIYYLYGTRGATCWGRADGFDVYTSADLTQWEGPFPAFTKPVGFWADRNFWAPEVHLYNGRYYMLASFKSGDHCRGTQILAADTPMGPFLPHSDGPVTPRDWECLDGTLYIENGQPYMVFCHEWLQVRDGEMCAIPLRQDLRTAAGDPVVLFRASQPSWAVRDAESYVTDGPFLYRAQTGALLMLWSSSRDGVYCQAVSRSCSGMLLGRWTHDPELLVSQDGGHGMVFRTFDGRLLFTCHQPNQGPLERPRLMEATEEAGALAIASSDPTQGDSKCGKH